MNKKCFSHSDNYDTYVRLILINHIHHSFFDSDQACFLTALLGGFNDASSNEGDINDASSNEGDINDASSNGGDINDASSNVGDINDASSNDSTRSSSCTPSQCVPHTLHLVV